MLWEGGGGTDVTLSVSDFSVPKPLHIHIFFDHDDKNIPPTYPMGLLIKDILNIQPSTENQALLPVSCKLYNFKLVYNKLAIRQFLSLWSMKQTPYYDTFKMYNFVIACVICAIINFKTFFSSYNIACKYFLRSSNQPLVLVLICSLIY